MEKEKDPNKEVKVIVPGGLHTDSSYVNQPPNTTSFALNAINESAEGDKKNRSNENSNEPCYELPPNTTPVGQVYIGDGNELIFLVDNTGNSIFAIADRECNLEIIFDDSGQTDKLGLKVNHQVSATFRLRKGCERTVYFVIPKPMVFIIDKPQKFQTAGLWDINKFSLFKTYNSIPDFNSIDVLDGQGSLLPGNYNFSIQYLDEDLNPTEFITSTETINIYNSNLNLPYRDVRGSTSIVQTFQDFGPTDKAIRVVLGNLDTSFPFYRLAITEANNGSGQIADTKYTAEISTQNNVFTYTGKNYQVIGEENEVLIFNTIIEAAGHIEQVENFLLLGEVKGKQINYCKLQKYASLITADMITKDVILNQNVTDNSKHPTAHIDGMGYMPGEIYSFGIVYIFKDNTTSPVYHIPGRNPSVDPNTMFSTGDNLYPMSNNNGSEDNLYIDNETCEDENYWGVDAENEVLTGEPVRHHRFPLRTDFNIPLVEKADSVVLETLFKKLSLIATGTIDTPTECAPLGDPAYDSGCVPSIVPEFSVEVLYTEDGNPDSFASVVDPADWGGDSTAAITFNAVSNLITGTNVVVTSILEDGVTVTGSWAGGVFTSVMSPKGLIYTITLTDALNQYTEDLFVGKVFGIKFSNIQLPDPAELGGNEIIGYYIVRNERTEDDKTILDSAILTSTVKNKNFVSAGLLMPQFVDDSLIQKDTLSFINPEFKFNGRKYTNFSSILQQGKFNKTEAIYSRTKINDVMDGTSYVAGKHKSGESDPDGWSIQIKTRDNITTSVTHSGFSIDPTEIKETFYLDALADKIIQDSTNAGIDVFNLACDNKTGIISLNHNITFPIMNSLPYVYFLKDNANPYANFRLSPYYKDSKNPHYFIVPSETATIFNGDSYICPMRYVNSIFYDNRIKKRKGKSSALSFIVGAILILAAVAITVFSLGAGSAVGVALISAGTSLLIGGGTLLIMSGIKQDAWNKAYNQFYKDGLRETIADDYVQFDTDPNNGHQRGFAKNPSDDEIQWLGDCINVWFESAVNMNVRHGCTDNTPDFLGAPGSGELGATVPEYDREYFGIHSVGTKDIPPTTTLDNHMVKKLLYFDYNRKQGKAYVGLALSEVYSINPDYTRRNKQKIYEHLPLEYDCCSDCTEDFPQRWHWSQQSFQEELTDNFRTFLPNNYKDLEGNTGRITDIFRIQNNLYLHTEDALWHQPQNFQERVTGDVVSFIGTGEYFNIPPRKIVDDTNSSAGTFHKWGRLKTKHGVLFPCHKEKKWYLFDGEKLAPLSEAGLSNYFREAMVFEVEEQYYTANQKDYPYSNNPSNRTGVGYISAYDSTKERLIVTKKDFKFSADIPIGTEICDEGEDAVMFSGIDTIIAEQADLGFTYVGIVDCKLKFIKTTYTETETIGQIITTIPNDTDIYSFYDTSGSFDGGQLATIRASVQVWFDNMVAGGFAGTLTHINNGTERWLNFPALIPAGGNVLVLTFVNEANAVYHGSGLETSLVAPTASYISDFHNFTDVIYPGFSSFVGINYPIVTGNIDDTTAVTFLQHSLAAVKGINYTLAQVNALEVNSAYTPTEWSTIKTSLMTNPYSTVLDTGGIAGLEHYNWYVKSNRNDLGTLDTSDCPASADIISPCQFQVDMEAILADQISVDETTIITYIPEVEIVEIEGDPLTLGKYQSGHTLSFSLEDKQWTSWHSYLPSLYISLENRWYGWKQAGTHLYKFNMPHSYGNFFGTHYPFIIEFVDNSGPLDTKVFDGFMFQTEAKAFDSVLREYSDEPNITFGKFLAYNTHQTTGIITMQFKNPAAINYMLQQTINNPVIALLDRNERDWTINSLRNYRVQNTPMFIKEIAQLQTQYFIDKVINPSGLNYNKDWTQMEPLRDKFLVVRLIFDTFDNVKLITNFSVQDKKVSER